MADMPDIVLHDLADALGKLGIHDHLCLIYETQEEQFSAVLPFIKLGLERGEKCIYVADDNTAAMVIDGMKAKGIDTDTAVKSGKLVIVSKQETYLKQGYFDPDWMIDFLKRATDEAKASGFSALRVTGEMTWVLSENPGTERIMEYEAKLNYFFAENDALAICQYNRNRFSPEVIKNVLATHPLVIYGGMVCRNFYYVPPDDFLAEQQPAREIDRFLANIVSRAKAEEALQRHYERLEELISERTTELLAGEERYRSLIRKVQAAIVVHDGQGRIISCNPLAQDLLGLSEDQLLGKTLIDAGWHFQREDGTVMPVAEYPASKVLATRQPLRSYVSGISRPDRSEVTWALVNGEPEYDDSGEISQVIVSFVDITERRRLEQERRANLKFFESMDHVNRAIHGTNDLHQMMRAVLDTVFSIFDCDRVWLFYPCDPYAPSFRVPMEITKPEYPGGGTLNMDMPMTADMALNLQEALESAGPVTYAVGTEKQINNLTAEQFGVKSQIMAALYPKSDKPWVFGMHQCSYARIWTIEEQRLFQEIGRRLADALTSLLAYQELNKLNKELESHVSERTSELEAKNAELEKFNKLFVNRELKMIELKERIKELEKRLA